MGQATDHLGAPTRDLQHDLGAMRQSLSVTLGRSLDMRETLETIAVSASIGRALGWSFYDKDIPERRADLPARLRQVGQNFPLRATTQLIALALDISPAQFARAVHNLETCAWAVSIMLDGRRWLVPVTPDGATDVTAVSTSFEVAVHQGRLMRHNAIALQLSGCNVRQH